MKTAVTYGEHCHNGQDCGCGNKALTRLRTTDRSLSESRATYSLPALNNNHFKLLVSLINRQPDFHLLLSLSLHRLILHPNCDPPH